MTQNCLKTNDENMNGERRQCDYVDVLAGKKSPNGSQKSPKKFVNCYIFKNLCKKKPKISYFVIIKIPRETITLSAKIRQIWSP
jgi:hypothetical protein